MAKVLVTSATPFWRPTVHLVSTCFLVLASSSPIAGLLELTATATNPTNFSDWTLQWDDTGDELVEVSEIASFSGASVNFPSFGFSDTYTQITGTPSIAGVSLLSGTSAAGGFNGWSFDSGVLDGWFPSRWTYEIGSVETDTDGDSGSGPDSGGSTPSLEDVVSNSVQVNAGIQSLAATFTPNLGFSLTEAANLGQFQSFSWINYITKDDALTDCISQATDECSNLELIDGSLPTVPFVDPPPGGYRYQRENGEFVDNLPYYYELGTEPATENELFFSDSPSDTIGNEIAFRTILAGVGQDPTDSSLLLFSGTWFEWTWTGQTEIDVKYRAANNPSVDVTADIDFRFLDPIADWGSAERNLFSGSNYSLIGNVPPNAVSVPEPSTFILAALGLVGIGFARRHKRPAGT